jgi:hypothetical protein
MAVSVTPLIVCVASTIKSSPRKLYTSRNSAVMTPAGESNDRFDVITNRSPSHPARAVIVIPPALGTVTSLPSTL